MGESGSFQGIAQPFEEKIGDVLLAEDLLFHFCNHFKCCCLFTKVPFANIVLKGNPGAYLVVLRFLSSHSLLLAGGSFYDTCVVAINQFVEVSLAEFAGFNPCGDLGTIFHKPAQVFFEAQVGHHHRLAIELSQETPVKTRLIFRLIRIEGQISRLKQLHEDVSIVALYGMKDIPLVGKLPHFEYRKSGLFTVCVSELHTLLRSVQQRFYFSGERVSEVGHDIVLCRCGTDNE